MTNASPTYTPTPRVPAALRERSETILAVLAGTLTVSAGARRLGLSRHRFQTLLHRGLQGLLTAVAPQRPGRPRRPAREVALTKETRRLRRAQQRGARRTAQLEQLLRVAKGALTARRSLSARSRSRAPAPRPPRAKDEEAIEPDPGASAQRLAHATELRRRGLSADLAAAVVGIHRATLARWAARARRREALARRRGPCRAEAPDPQQMEHAAVLVRATHGLVGADALRQSLGGLSRRQAAAIKRATCRAMEHERRAGAQRITITTPGVLRGFDAMHVPTAQGPWHLLVAADGCVPYRTSCLPVRRYDGAAVARTLERDFQRHGPPLVCRLDRARAHAVPAVQAIFQAYGVLALHGPPRCPRFYGQLERQNREHRQWLDALGSVGPELLPALSAELCATLNRLWPRRALDWRTPQEAWQSRPGLRDDRMALQEEVLERSHRIRQQLDVRGKPADLAERLAIEQVLEQRGYLRRETGGWC